MLTLNVHSSVPDSNGGSISQRKSIRRTPSAPELAQDRKREAIAG
jgi:hypothetical protein